MRRIEENIPHPEQWREWPDEAAATMAVFVNGANSFRRSAYEMRAAVKSLPYLNREAFLVGMRFYSKIFYELREVPNEEDVVYIRVRHRGASGQTR